MALISRFFGRRLVPNSFFLLARALLFDGKIRQSTALIWFGLQIFYTDDPRTIVNSPAVLETGLAEKIAVCTHTTRLLKK
jgi:hypothetical protein